MILSIETGTDNPVLRQKAKPVAAVSKKTLKLIKDMEETMKKANGVGLAAPQVGVSERVILITLNNKRVLALINPQIVAASSEKEWGEEGCLSLPGYWGKVERCKEVTLEFMTEKGQQMRMDFKDFEARELQHEIDHLNGILFTDYLDQADIIYDPQSLGEVRMV